MAPDASSKRGDDLDTLITPEGQVGRPLDEAAEGEVDDQDGEDSEDDDADEDEDDRAGIL
jgi:hypothetical protein